MATSLSLKERSFFWLIAERLNTALTSFFLIYIIASNYEIDVLGKFQYCLALVIMSGILSQFVDERIAKRFISEAETDITLSLTVLRTMLYSLGIFLSSAYILVSRPDLAPMFGLLALIFSGNNFVFGSVCRNDLMFENAKITKVNVIANVLAFISVSGLISLNVELLNILCVYSVIIALKILFIYATNSVNISFNGAVIKVIPKSLYLAMASIVSIIYIRVDQLMVEYYLGYESIAIFAFSANLFSLCILLIAPAQIFLYNIIVKDFRINLEYSNLYKSVTHISTLFGFSVVLVIYLMIDKFHPYINDNFDALPSIFILHGLNAVLFYNSIMRANHIALLDKGRILLWIQVIALFLNILMNVLFIPRYGVIGAGWASVLTQWFSLLLSNFFFKDLRYVAEMQIRSLFNINIMGSLRQIRSVV